MSQSRKIFMLQNLMDCFCLAGNITAPGKMWAGTRHRSTVGRSAGRQDEGGASRRTYRPSLRVPHRRPPRHTTWSTVTENRSRRAPWRRSCGGLSRSSRPLVTNTVTNPTRNARNTTTFTSTCTTIITTIRTPQCLSKLFTFFDGEILILLLDSILHHSLS